MTDGPHRTSRRAHGDRAHTMTGQITDLEGLDRAGCLEHWQTAFGRPPPKHLSLTFLRNILIWHLQCEALGTVPPATDSALRRIAAGGRVNGAAEPSTLLVREWNGRTYQVEVTEDGYVMDGRTWRSLSAIARHITGAHWSGPRFFGLTGKAGQ